MSLTTSFQLNITQVDANNANDLSRAFTGSYTGSFGQYNQSLSIPTSLTVITLPGSPVLQLFIKNLDATNYVTVTWTPTGIASVVTKRLYPGESIFFYSTNASSGITALALQSNTAACLVEMFLGG